MAVDDGTHTHTHMQSNHDGVKHTIEQRIRFVYKQFKNNKNGAEKKNSNAHAFRKSQCARHIWFLAGGKTRDEQSERGEKSKD